MRPQLIVTLAALVACPAVSQAAFSSSHLSKIGEFVQTSAAVPTVGTFRFHAEFNVDGPTDKTASQGTRPDSSTFPFVDVNPGTSTFDAGGYASAAAMDAFYGSGVYKYAVTAGDLAPAALTINVPADRLPDVVPTFTPATFAGLASLLPGQDFMVDSNQFTPDPTANFGLVTFIVRDSVGSEVFNNTLFVTSPVDPMFNLPGSVILPGESYVFDLRYYNVTLDHDIASPIETAIEHQYITTAAAQAQLPEPASLAGCGVAVAALARRRRVF